MVNVAGRSRGCVTCRRRKKGCDLQKPDCGQCRKACIPCGGYQPRQHKFVLETYTSSNITSQHLLDSSRATDEILLPAALESTAYQSKYIDLFWAIHLPRGAGNWASKSTLASGWFETVHNLCPSNQLLRKMTLAIAFNTIGRNNNNMGLSMEGPKLYGEVLNGVAVALQKSKGLVADDGLLAVVRLLSLYEAMYAVHDQDTSKQVRSWLAHCVGDAALIKTRSPAAYAIGHAHRLFIDGRLHLATMAIKARKRSSFSHPDWKTLPWMYHEKSPRDYLVDILIDIPSLFEDVDKLEIGDDASRSQVLRVQLQADYLRLDELLTAWRDEYNPSDRMVPEHLTTDELPSSITSDELAATNLAVLYWTTCVLLYGLVREVMLAIAHKRKWQLSESIEPSEQRNASIACSRIIKTLRVFIHADAGTYRVHLITFPLSVVLMYYLESKPDHNIPTSEQAIIADCLQRPECVTIRRFLSSMHSKKL